MAVVVVTTEERSALQGNAPSAEAIAGALERARLAGAEDVRGAWIGSPRVTRVAIPPSFTTRIAAVYGWPTRGPWTPGAPLRELSIALRDAVARELGELGRWAPVRVIPWAEEQHGALSRWESGELARTRTRDAFPVGAGRLDPEENPTGPDSRDRRPSTAGELFGEGLAGLAPWALAALALWAWSSRGRR